MTSKDDFGNEMIKTVFGNIPNDWKLIDFKDILKIRSEKSNNEEIVKYSITNTGIHKRDEKFNKQLSKSSSKFKIIYKNDLVFGMSREILNFGVMKEDIGGVSSAYNVFKIDESIDPRYLELFIRVWSEYFKDIIKPASREGQGIDKNILLTKQFILPTNEYLQNFFYVFDTFNEKIELNNQMNQTLENICKAIFKHWFIHFEFPNENGNPYKSNGGKMVDSELKEIPLGWKVGTISDLCSSITNGGTPKRKEPAYWENGTIPWFKTGELFDGPLIDSEEHITEEGLKNSSCKLWEPNTVLIALYASPTVGRLGILKNYATSNQACSGLIAKKDFGYQFLFCNLLSKRKELNSIAVGSAQQNISQDIIQNTKTIIPSSQITIRFQELIEIIFEQKTLLMEESNNLAKIRDSLLPKLMSSKIHINLHEGGSANEGNN